MKIAVLFGAEGVRGRIGVVNGSLGKLLVVGAGKVSGDEFVLPRGGRLEIAPSGAVLRKGSRPTIINVFTERNPFSFFLRDVSSENPVYVPEFKAAAVPAGDKRSFQDIAECVRSRMLVSDLGRFENEPEESYENACRHNWDQYCQTWLGLGRDMRIFRVGRQPGNLGYWGQIQPCYHSMMRSYTPGGKDYYQIHFEIGPGVHCRNKGSRRLEGGVLPILRAVQDEAQIQYHITSFATLENQPISEKAVRGSEWRACYPNTGGNMLSKEEKDELREILEREMYSREQEIVCVMRVEAVNTGRTPEYAFFKAPHHHAGTSGTPKQGPERFEKGMSLFEELGKVFAVSLIDGDPMMDEEMAIMLQPGERTLFDILVPHSPLDLRRAGRLFRLDIGRHLGACRKFWTDKLASAAGISVPEAAVDERIRAGLLHCDLATLGLEPDGPALATIGWYSPIGTESSPIIQFYDSMGWHGLAERSMDFFLERQKEDGFIQNFANYQSETGSLLWTAGEHFRYTRDLKWLRRVWPRLRKSAGYLLEWRGRNKREELRNTGCYGMVDGKVADPEDFYHSYFLNAGTYAGLSRMAEMARSIDARYARSLQKEVQEYRRDIVKSVYFAQSRAPLIPVGDGSWAPILPSWAEHTGAHHLYAEGAKCFTHGGFTTRNSLIGANWLIIQEVLDPREEAADFIIKTNQRPMTVENASFSQPYYSRHDFAHIRRGEVKPFLKAYYNQFSALQDRETYSFWEHYFGCSEHKTHEEAWFLMQTRWMLYLEEDDTLSFLKAIPRKWLEDGKTICLDGVKSYFGTVHFRAESDLKNGIIRAKIRLDSGRGPAKIAVRIPHPEGLRAKSCEGGSYCPSTETVTVGKFSGSSTVALKFA